LAKPFSVFLSNRRCLNDTLGHEFTNKKFRFGILVEGTKGRIVSLAHSRRFLRKEGVLATKLKNLTHGDEITDSVSELLKNASTERVVPIDGNGKIKFASPITQTTGFAIPFGAASSAPRLEKSGTRRAKSDQAGTDLPSRQERG
jgi:hypothetical protein